MNTAILNLTTALDEEKSARQALAFQLSEAEQSRRIFSSAIVPLEEKIRELSSTIALQAVTIKGKCSLDAVGKHPVVSETAKTCEQLIVLQQDSSLRVKTMATSLNKLVEQVEDLPTLKREMATVVEEVRDVQLRVAKIHTKEMIPTTQELEAIPASNTIEVGSEAASVPPEVITVGTVPITNPQPSDGFELPKPTQELEVLNESVSTVAPMDPVVPALEQIPLESELLEVDSDQVPLVGSERIPEKVIIDVVPVPVVEQAPIIVTPTVKSLHLGKRILPKRIGKM
jgi:uncharacterized coiled-coil protein SlyX